MQRTRNGTSSNRSCRRRRRSGGRARSGTRSCTSARAALRGRCCRRTFRPHRRCGAGSTGSATKVICILIDYHAGRAERSRCAYVALEENSKTQITQLLIDIRKSCNALNMMLKFNKKRGKLENLQLSRFCKKLPANASEGELWGRFQRSDKRKSRVL